MIGEMNQRIREQWIKVKADWEFACDFYDALDEVQASAYVDALAPGLERLLGFEDRGDGKISRLPLRNSDSIARDIHAVLYGLGYWRQIKEALGQGRHLRQVDLIRELGMDRPTAGYFFWVMAGIGALEKRMDGRYNLLSFGRDELSPADLARGWPALFDPAQRFVMPEVLAAPPVVID